MFLATSNKAMGFLHMSYIGRVRASDLRHAHNDVLALLTELPAGFKLLVDLGRLESMDTDCVEVIGKIMEILDRHGLKQVVRVIPDPTKDIGLNNLSRFHHSHNLQITNCKTMSEAVKLLWPDDH